MKLPATTLWFSLIAACAIDPLPPREMMLEDQMPDPIPDPIRDRMPEEVPDPILVGLASVCWIETGTFLTNTGSGILIRHRSGNVLLDAGNSTNFDHEVSVYPPADRAWYSVFPRALIPRTPLPNALRAAGLEPEELSFFLASHPHADHVGGLMDLPDLPVLMPVEDIALVQRARAAIIFEVVPAHAEKLAPLVEPLVFAPIAYRGFSESADLFGDQTVIAVRLAGHTPGSIGVFIRVREGVELFHVGDAVTTLAQLESEAMKPEYLQRTDYDPEVAHDTVVALHALQQSSPDLAIIPAHDRPAWVTAFGEPGGCLVP